MVDIKKCSGLKSNYEWILLSTKAEGLKGLD